MLLLGVQHESIAEPQQHWMAPKLGGAVLIEATSNAYGLRSINNESFDASNLYSEKLFAKATAKASLLAALGDCRLSIEHVRQAAATTDRSTMQTYRKVDRDGLDSALGNLDLSYRSVGYEGSGVGLGCLGRWGVHQAMLQARWLNLSSFREKRYSGAVSTNLQKRTTLSLRETAISMAPQLPQLQVGGSGGQVVSVDIDYTVQSADDRLMFEVLVENAWSRVDLDNAAFLNRALDVSVEDARVVSSDQVSPLTGQYGNSAFRLKLPRLWSTALGYEFKREWHAGMEASGVGAAYQPMGFVQHGGARLAVDTRGRHLVLGYRSGGWRLGMGVRTAQAPGTSRVDHLVLGYSFLMK